VRRDSAGQRARRRSSGGAGLGFTLDLGIRVWALGSHGGACLGLGRGRRPDYHSGDAFFFLRGGCDLFFIIEKDADLVMG
jgi:hypothetical protein